MSEQQLLELAAKSVGINGTWCQFPGMIQRHGFDGAIYDEVECEYWNPLADDGDALRLAVDLSLQVKPCETGVDVCDEAGGEVWCEFTEPNSCHYQMTRRAIVCAAAEMGKAMQEKH